MSRSAPSAGRTMSGCLILSLDLCARFAAIGAAMSGRYLTRPAPQVGERDRADHEVCLMAAKGWQRRFDEPIKLRNGKKLVTLKDAIAWLAKEVPRSEHTMKEIQNAAHCVTEAAENGGPMQFARMGMMQAINRHGLVEFDPKQKSPHWGKRKLKRDQ
jgi:hypothetical protein